MGLPERWLGNPFSIWLLMSISCFGSFGNKKPPVRLTQVASLLSPALLPVLWGILRLSTCSHPEALAACYVALRSVHCTVPLVLGPKDPGRSSTVRSTLPAGGYRSTELTTKPRPDFHRLAVDSFQDTPSAG